MNDYEVGPGSTSLLQGAYDRARSDPEATAVISDGGTASWAELLSCARSVDFHSTPPGIIIIDCGRRPEAIAGIVACVEASRTFLFADDGLPERRQAAIADDCAAVGTLRCDGRGGLSLVPSSRIAAQQIPTGGLYWIYTSGSSGKPKGTVIPVSAISALLPALHERVPELDSARCLGVTASFGFDPALQQIFLGLHGGITLALPRDEVRRSPEALLEFWAAHGVDIADGTPLLLRMLVRVTDRFVIPPSVRCLLIGGDLLKAQDIRAFWERFGAGVAIYNLYGVAECGIDSAAGKVSPDQLDKFKVLPVGTELAHCTLLLLDDKKSLVPPGGVGEVYIGGAGVGPGYPTQPDETGRALIDLDGMGTFFRTGDCAKRLESGVLVVTGRVDRQVKVSGRRVEPAEVEAAILEWVSERVALVERTLRPAPDIRRCARCVVSEHYPGSAIDKSGLCRYCRLAAGSIASGWGYFRPIESLERMFSEARETRPGAFDALVLFSGGKDSSYVLYRLLEMGAKVAAFTFDNGFISDGAFANIERICSENDVPHRYGYAENNTGLLAESLRADATVCSGCFVGITATGAAMAVDLSCRFVVSGLSRGQIIDTKLLQYIRRGRTDLSDIDAELGEHRRLFLERRSAFSRAVSTRSAEGVASKTENVDYFRYDPVGGSRIHEYLAARDTRWRNPKDTGVCSTNCRANDAGIAEHLTKRGYHNYEGPLSWEVRLGTLMRAEALAKVETGVDQQNVALVHQRLGYRAQVAVVPGERDRLVAYVEGHLPADVKELRSWLASRLPSYMIPAQVTVLPDGLPKLSHDKIDYAALRALSTSASAVPVELRRVGDGLTDRIKAAWSDVLGRAPTSEDDDFFQIGGDSLAATELGVRIEDRVGVSIPVITIFELPVFRAYRDAVSAQMERPGKLPDSVAPSALGLRIQEISSTAGRGEPATVFLMPDVAGRALSLPKLFATACRGLPISLLALGYSAETWPSMVTLDQLAAEMAMLMATRVNYRRLVVVGWSFGAILAARTSHALAEVLAAGSSPAAVECWLLDPPETSQTDALELKTEIVGRLVQAFPQLTPALRSQGDWSEILAVIERARKYRDGERRVIDAQPDLVRRSLPGDATLRGGHLMSALITIIRTLEVIAREADPPAQDGSPTRRDPVVFRRFLPLQEVGAHGSNGRTSGPSLWREEFLEGVDHWSMIDPGQAALYARCLAKVCSEPSQGERE